MKLNIGERLTLVNLVPEKGNFETMSTVEALRLLLYPSEKEVSKFEIKQTEKQISWNAEGSKSIEVKLTENQFSMLKGELERRSEKNELDLPQYSLLKKFRETNL